jgi:5-methylcytosine-specific restriction endonuclease McrA
MKKSSEGTYKIFIPIGDRPKCVNPECNNARQHMGTYRKDGTPLFRSLCAKHHGKKVAEKHGLNSIEEVVAKNAGCASPYEYLNVRAKKAGFASYADQLNANAIREGFASHADRVSSMNELRAKEAGFASYIDYMNSKHSYRKHRKNYCENIDGRLGYICNYPIKISAQLQVDHINGDPYDNREENCQTLCANCHTYKTHVSKDYSTPGRKKMKTKNQKAILVN